MNKHIITSILVVFCVLVFTSLALITWKHLLLTLYVLAAIGWACLYARKPHWPIRMQLFFNALSAASFPKRWYQRLQIFLSPLWPIGALLEITCFANPLWREKMYNTD